MDVQGARVVRQSAEVRPPNKGMKLTKPSTMELRSLTLCPMDLRWVEADVEVANGQAASQAVPC